MVPPVLARIWVFWIVPGRCVTAVGCCGPGIAGIVIMPGLVLLLYCAGWRCQAERVRPRIRYCVTPAGRVAYSTVGTGPALLCDTGWITDLRAQLELFSFGSFIERLAERFTVIRYD